jgi:hypothetical protein
MLNGHASGWFIIIRSQRQGAPGCWNNKLHDNYCERVGIGSRALRGRLPRRALVSPWYAARFWRAVDEFRHQGWPVYRATTETVDHRPLKRWVHTCNVTAYRNTESWQCGRDSWPRNVSKVGYAVTLRACLVRCLYLAVASKGWYGYGLSRSGRATWHFTTVRSSRLLCIHDASGSSKKLETPWCNARRILLRHEARDESSDRNSVSCQSLATLRRYGPR